MLLDHPEYLALLRGVLENPQDDAVRLILSDWLEENGEEERAVFIRRAVNEKWVGVFIGNNTKISPGVEAYYDRGLIGEVRLTCAEFMGGTCKACQGSGRIATLSAVSSYLPKCPDCKGTGRIEGVARALFERHPITTVRIVARNPGYYMNVNRPVDSWYWVRGTDETMHFETRLPVDVCKHLVGYFYEEDGVYQFGSEAAAIAALSDAAVAYGRSLVGLPALTPA